MSKLIKLKVDPKLLETFGLAVERRYNSIVTIKGKRSIRLDANVRDTLRFIGAHVGPLILPDDVENCVQNLEIIDTLKYGKKVDLLYDDSGNDFIKITVRFSHYGISKDAEQSN